MTGHEHNLGNKLVEKFFENVDVLSDISLRQGAQPSKHGVKVPIILSYAIPWISTF